MASQTSTSLSGAITLQDIYNNTGDTFSVSTSSVLLVGSATSNNVGAITIEKLIELISGSVSSASIVAVLPDEDYIAE